MEIAAHAAGIVLSLMVYSVLQERIMTRPFGEDEDIFKFSLFLVLCNRLVTCTLAVGCLLPVAPSYNYAVVSLSNVLATTCQYEALKYVTFPLQTLGKCAKMIPVMAWGSIMLHKRYKKRDYVLAVAITTGLMLFFLTGPVSSKRQHAKSDAVLWGSVLMLGYLGFDGFTSTFQDKLFKGYNMSTYNQMLYVNLFSSLVSLCGLVSSGQLLPALAFIARHPEALSSIFVLSLSATVGQLFILHTIKKFGALLFAAVMTTRQFLSILVSSAVFGNPLSTGQWCDSSPAFTVQASQSFLLGNCCRKS
ncbi:DMT family transporter: UDP-galactose/UDP-glucose [Coccomyxa subellipsoidea C-169]|uniref:DMT family transporter: UDP-galactose/UDP-glucose n=1 Tax=Coccomyxa subellipsoidea (strain C-169) TaxID=574566 RepID=I0ZA87_COCSC|nr:DMT family transporter: UDP-galactose/UDP-glucose [Coccomyxa subellipsoidea C-169]EIE27556.1 DMT family transporter: UDP-galactose/UDP-glucose [Coccomyxa subellipsoidea C-169]|eukprot:XP_005652100.1 DMT family transporter: UDP-galactose/UDP-glucose [Coccomyxa subellipsoidea C-169]